MKTIFDRNVTLFESFKSLIPTPKQKGKKAVIVISAASPWPFNVLHMRQGYALKEKYLSKARQVATALLK